MQLSHEIPSLPPRDADSHKGTFGRVLIVGGSRGMTGAISLTATAALRSGAGLVQVAVPDRCLATVAGYEPSYTTFGLPSDSEGRFRLAAIEQLLKLAEPVDVVALGPGLQRSAALDRLVARLFAGLAKPLVIDADGLNALAALAKPWPQPAGPRILTPHPGEFMRLGGSDSIFKGEEARRRAHELAGVSASVIVLKGHGTFVTDGEKAAINYTGNPGMATGGSGDVLTGVTAAILGQGLEAWDAARLAVHVHGLAGDFAASELGEVSLIASDLLRFLPLAFKSL